MTDQEMKDRMKEIDIERESLRKERLTYEQYFHNREQSRRLEERKQYVGKCFKVDTKWENRNVIYFKVLHIDDRDLIYATCICIGDGYDLRTSKEIDVKIAEIPLWYYNKDSFLHSENEPRLIDLCSEISNADFIKVYEEYIDRFSKEISVS